MSEYSELLFNVEKALVPFRNDLLGLKAERHTMKNFGASKGYPDLDVPYYLLFLHEVLFVFGYDPIDETYVMGMKTPGPGNIEYKTGDKNFADNFMRLVKQQNMTTLVTLFFGSQFNLARSTPTDPGLPGDVARTAAMLDKVADSLEAKGLTKEAAEIDVISNTLEAYRRTSEVV